MKKRRCFVLSPLGDEESKTREHADQVLKHLIEPCFDERKYDVGRADKDQRPGIITTQIIQRIFSADVIVAVLTEHNPNVFYEFAIAHALRKPWIQLIRHGEKIPFDVNASRTVIYDLTNPDKVIASKSEISSQLKSIEESDLEYDNAVTAAIDINVLRQRNTQTDELLARMLERLNSLEGAIESVAGDVSSIPYDIDLPDSIDETRMTARIADIFDLKFRNFTTAPDTLNALKVASRIHDIRKGIVVLTSAAKTWTDESAKAGLELLRESFNDLAILVPKLKLDRIKGE